VSTRRHGFAVAVVVLAVVAAACSSGKSHKSAAKAPPAAASAAPTVSLANNVPSGVKVGLIVSGSGPGADVRDMAAGAYVAAFRLNGGKATTADSAVHLVVADDNGTAEGATAAMKSMVDQGVLGVVYASTGDHIAAGVSAAAESGMPVILPYADDGALGGPGKTSFVAAPTIAQVAGKLVQHIGKAGFSKVALLRQGGSYGDAGKDALSVAGASFVADVPFDASAPAADPAKAALASSPDAIVIWAEAGPALAAADALSVAGNTHPLLLADRAAVPAFGHGVAAALAPPVADGVVSVGEWAGADTPTAAVDAFYLARDRAVSDGGVTADLGLADFRSHDAVLAIVGAATAAHSTQASAVLDALRSMKSVSGAAGVPVDFGAAKAVPDDAVALVSYSTVDDGRGRYPAAATAGGHWVAVAGTFTPPEALKGLDNPYGG
jgi:ABC-type branched-subunit amino acid transport system substrate-binding protein